jgi:plastocyanin
MATTQTQPASLALPTARSLFDRKPFYILLATTGFALIGVAGLVMLAMGLMAGDIAETLQFAAFFLVPSLLGIILSWAVGRWGLILPVLLVLALLVMFGPFLPFALAHPEGGQEFIMVALFAVGALLAVIGGGISLGQWLRRSARPGASPAQRLAYKGILGATLALVVVSVVATTLARTSLPAEVRAGTTPVGIKEFAFGDSLVTVNAGETVRLAVRNDDSALHTFTLAEAGIDVVIPAGAERLVEFQAPAAGTYTFYCVPHSAVNAAGRREGMVGTLAVRP